MEYPEDYYHELGLSNKQIEDLYRKGLIIRPEIWDQIINEADQAHQAQEDSLHDWEESIKNFTSEYPLSKIDTNEFLPIIETWRFLHDQRGSIETAFREIQILLEFDHRKEKLLGLFNRPQNHVPAGILLYLLKYPRNTIRERIIKTMWGIKIIEKEVSEFQEVLNAVETYLKYQTDINKLHEISMPIIRNWFSKGYIVSPYLLSIRFSPPSRFPRWSREELVGKKEQEYLTIDYWSFVDLRAQRIKNCVDQAIPLKRQDRNPLKYYLGFTWNYLNDVIVRFNRDARHQGKNPISNRKKHDYIYEVIHKLVGDDLINELCQGNSRFPLNPRPIQKLTEVTDANRQVWEFTKRWNKIINDSNAPAAIYRDIFSYYFPGASDLLPVQRSYLFPIIPSRKSHPDQ